ncbi:MAG TPA: DNA primase catalytic subunit PriS, partial [Thermoplasmatales archaeon]|nr:DNA primase catalytic subunit PriS [Thermoplasmatales archaeon]
AFYQKPDAPTMDEKEWMGAELIFDLDLDHLKGAEGISYEEGLKLVKEEFRKLVEEFLLDDFGFSKNKLLLYFSGGRGYHCHVVDPNVFKLSSSERREIVDYITGADLDEETLFRKRVVEKTKVKGRMLPSVSRLEIPRPSEPGWRGRVGRGLIALLKEVTSEGNNIEHLKRYGINRKDIERLKKELTKERMLRIAEDGVIDQSPFIRRFFLKAAIQKAAISSMAGETDEPVTCDIKRLIRLPSSLHGKTGFKVCRIKIDELEGFEPLRDAIVFSDEKVEVDVAAPLKIRMIEESFNLRKGKQRVPEYLAVFLVARRMAKVI